MSCPYGPIRLGAGNSDDGGRAAIPGFFETAHSKGLTGTFFGTADSNGVSCHWFAHTRMSGQKGTPHPGGIRKL